MKKIRVLSLLLCVLLAFGVMLTACTVEDEVSEGGGETSASADDAKWKNEDGKYTIDNLGMTFNFSQKEFRVVVYNNAVQTTYYSEEVEPGMYDTTDDQISNAVKIRNDILKEKFGVEVTAIAVDDVMSWLSNDLQTSDEGQGGCDLAMPFMPSCTNLAKNGQLLDLKEYDNYIHLDAPWWDQVANSSLDIGGRLFFTIGDISIMQKITSMAITFNRDMYKNSLEQDYGDLYQMVRDGKWTFDTMYEMGKKVTADTAEPSGMTYEDTWGISTSNDDALKFYLSFGQSLVRKDENGNPYRYIGTQAQTTTLSQHIIETLLKGDEWAMNNQKMVSSGSAPGNIWVASLAVFGEGRALFRTTAFSAIKKLRQYEMKDFGIIPMPKADEMQDDYYTPNSSKFSYGVCIPRNVPNPEFSAFMLEAMCCYSKDTLTYAYYDTVLKLRDSKNPEDEEMLDDYIFDNIVYDLGLIYGFGGIDLLHSNLMAENSTGIVGKLQGMQDAVDIAIEELVETYAAIS